MKKIILLCVFLVLMTVSCRKEEPKPQYQQPSGQTQALDQVRLLEDAVKKDPGNDKAWVSLGNALMDASHFSEAIDAYQKALSIDPKNVDVIVDLGTCYRNAGKPDLAVAEYKKALKLNPNHLNAHRNMGVVLAYDLKDKKQALKEFETYLQLTPNAPDAEKIKQEIKRLKTG